MHRQRVVLTGAPGTGKTSIILKLLKDGNHCFEEISREIIKIEMAKKSDVLPWDNLEAFSERVMDGRVADFNKAQEQLSFYDRSVLDTIAYLHYDNIPVRADWDTTAKNLRYNTKVFITPPWVDIFETDNERKESYGQLEDLHKILISTYEEYGYELINVPKTTIEKRVEFILKSLEV